MAAITLDVSWRPALAKAELRRRPCRLAGALVLKRPVSRLAALLLWWRNIIAGPTALFYLTREPNWRMSSSASIILAREGMWRLMWHQSIISVPAKSMPMLEHGKLRGEAPSERLLLPRTIPLLADVCIISMRNSAGAA